MRNPLSKLLLASLALLALAACGAIYRPDVQQGNVLSGEKFEQLKPGLSKAQVLALLGSPSIVSPFDANRWNYVATLQRRGGPIRERTLTLQFNGDTLASSSGDIMQESPQELLLESRKYGPLYPTNLTKQEQKELEKKQQQGG